MLASVWLTPARVSAQAGDPLQIEKTVYPDPVKPGEQMTYTITVSNRGVSALTGVTLTDQVPAGMNRVNTSLTEGASCTNFCDPGDLLTWSLGVIPAGRSVTKRVRMTAAAGVADGTVLLNNAIVTASNGATDSAIRDVTVKTSRTLLLGMAEDQEPIEPDGVLTYTLTYGNQGMVDTSGVTLSAAVPEGTSFVGASNGGTFANGTVSWSLGTLHVGESGQQQFTVQVAGNVPEGSILVSEAEMVNTSNPPLSARAAETTVVHIDNPLQLEKSVFPDPAEPGEQLTYTVTVSNRGASALTVVTLTDQVPAGMNRVNTSLTEGASCTNFCDRGDLLTWSLGTIPAGRSVTKRVRMTVATGVADGTVLFNNAVVTASNGAMAWAKRAVEVTAPNRTLMLGMGEDQEPIEPGNLVTYTLTYGNQDSVDAQDAPGAILNVTVPEVTSFVSASDGGTVANGVVSWSLGTLLVGENGQRQFTVQVAGNVSEGSILVSEAELHDTSIPPLSARAVETTVVHVDNPLQLEKTVFPNPAKPGEQVTYTVTVANRGVSELTNVTVTDQVPAGMNRVNTSLTEGASCTNFCDQGDILTWSLGTIPAGHSVVRRVRMIVNANVADGTVLFNNTQAVASNGATALVERVLEVEPNRTLMLGMGEDREPVAPGGTLTYTLTYGNQGSVDAQGAILRATVPEGTTCVSSPGGTCASGVVSWPLGTIQVGQGNKVQFTVQVMGDVPEGSILLSEAELLDTSNPPLSARAAETTAVHISNPLRVEKTVSLDAVPPGGQLTYTLTVTNQGGSELTGVTLTDLVPVGMNRVNTSLTEGASCTNFCDPGDLLTWNLGAISAGNSMTKHVQMTVRSSNPIPPDGTLIFNNAHVSHAGVLFAGAAEAPTMVCLNGGNTCLQPPPPPRTLSISVIGSGSVTSSPGGITCPGDCTENYPMGTVVTLTPTPVNGASFVSWSGHTDCSDGQVMLDVNKSCTATFTQPPIPKPDLTGSWLSRSQSCKTVKGQLKCTVKGNFKEENIGTPPAGKSKTQFFLSDDQVQNAGDLLLKTVSVAVLQPGKSKTLALSKALATGINATGKYLIACVDSAQAVDELNENNCVASGPIP